MTGVADLDVRQRQAGVHQERAVAERRVGGSGVLAVGVVGVQVGLEGRAERRALIVDADPAGVFRRVERIDHRLGVGGVERLGQLDLGVGVVGAERPGLPSV